MSFKTFLAIAVVVIPQWVIAAKKNIKTLPTTHVKASPLRLSEDQRKKRMQQEAETEKQMLRELEEARIAAERRRRQNQEQTQRPVAPRPRPVARPSYEPKVINQEPIVTPAPVIAAPLKVVNEERSWYPYFSLLGGLIDQHESANVQGNGGGGLSLGLQSAGGFAIEGTFVYGNHTSQHAYCKDANANCGVNGLYDQVSNNNVDQYFASLGAKYFIDLGFWLQPSIGILVAYNYREHAPNGTANLRVSQALDGGGSLGFDILFSKYIRVGLDWRYLTNLTYQQDGVSLAPSLGLREVSIQSGNELVDYESTDYQLWLLSAKFLF